MFNKVALAFLIISLASANLFLYEDAAPKNGSYKPVVQMHGMGDFAANTGMVQLEKLISARLGGTYVTNAALGSTSSKDQMSEFTQMLWTEVDSFKKFVDADPKLAKGFNAIGYSQGNIVIRGYVEKYNNPRVHNWVSVHGPNVGVIGMPHCNYGSLICKWFDEFLGTLAYTSLAQNSLAQANYLRDPKRIPQYLEHCKFMPDANNEVTVNQTYKENFASLEAVALVKALKDTMVYPNDSEWFGYYEDGSDKTILQMNETTWYKNDTFGLRTLDEANKISFYTTPGDHLHFTDEFIMGLVDKYFTN